MASRNNHEEGVYAGKRKWALKLGNRANRSVSERILKEMHIHHKHIKYYTHVLSKVIKNAEKSVHTIK